MMSWPKRMLTLLQIPKPPTKPHQHHKIHHLVQMPFFRGTYPPVRGIALLLMISHTFGVAGHEKMRARQMLLNALSHVFVCPGPTTRPLERIREAAAIALSRIPSNHFAEDSPPFFICASTSRQLIPFRALRPCIPTQQQIYNQSIHPPCLAMFAVLLRRLDRPPWTTF